MKLKALILFILLVITCNLSNAQTPGGKVTHERVGITFSSFGNSDIIYFESILGTASYSHDNFFSFGISYIHPWKSWLEIETAVEYAQFSMEGESPYPLMSDISFEADVALLDIPVTLRANFLNYFYANGGLLFDIDMSDSNVIDSQTGLGGILGVGVTYDFTFGASVFLNPYIKMHSAVPFSKEGYHQRLTESGIRFGVTYRID